MKADISLVFCVLTDSSQGGQAVAWRANVGHLYRVPGPQAVRDLSHESDTNSVCEAFKACVCD